MLKKLFRTPFVTAFLARLAAGYMTLIFKTCRWTFIGRSNIQPYWDEKKPLITCFWHGRMLMMPCAWQSTNPFSMLISGHADGRFIARAIEHHGLGTVTGSSSKGGLAALRSLLSLLKQGASVGITPDGPRGPRHKVSDGIMTLSRLSGVDILPATYSTSLFITINSWDRFRIPIPFSRAVMIWGKPLPAPSKALSSEDLDTHRQALEDCLNDLCDQADHTCHSQTSLQEKTL